MLSEIGGTAVVVVVVELVEVDDEELVLLEVEL